MDKIPIIDLKPQYNALKDRIDRAVQEVMAETSFILGPHVKNFESATAEYLGVKHAIGVNSGTDALIIALAAAGIGPGDEVITTPFSFFATAESISRVGAEPVFCDVGLICYNIDTEKIRALITPNTKAIMPVHLFGHPANMDRIMKLAEEFDLKVIEDCAQSFGAVYSDPESAFNNKYTGTIGTAGAFSFFPTKNLGAYGDGGIIVTNDDETAELAAKLRTHGSVKKYQNEMLGYNSRLDSIQAVILNEKLPYVKEWNLQRRRVAEKYNGLLEDIPGIIPPEICDGHVFHQYTVRVKDNKRDELKEKLADKGIFTMVYYPLPQDRLPVYKGQYSANPNSDILADEVLSLPIWPELEDSKIEYICSMAKEIMKEI